MSPRRTRWDPRDYCYEARRVPKDDPCLFTRHPRTGERRRKTELELLDTCGFRIRGETATHFVVDSATSTPDRKQGLPGERIGRGYVRRRMDEMPAEEREAARFVEVVRRTDGRSARAEVGRRAEGLGRPPVGEKASEGQRREALAMLRDPSDEQVERRAVDPSELESGDVVLDDDHEGFRFNGEPDR